MTTATAEKNAKAKVTETLIARGCELLKAENRFGETRTGWWMDGTYLAPKNDPAAALRLLNGGG